MEVEIHGKGVRERPHTGKLKLAESQKFNHPFEKPYDVQMALMDSIYKTIDGDYKIGIFESPTGTGKTLSLICSTMTWLREYKKMVAEAETETAGNGHHGGSGVGTAEDDDDEDDDDDDDEPEWVKQAYKEKIVGRMLQDARMYEAHLEELAKHGPEMITGDAQGGRGTVRHFKKRKTKQKVEAEDDDLAPEDYFEEGTGQDGTKYSKMDAEVRALLDKLETRRPQKRERASKANESPMRIYFSSRTHSQLTQFSSQLRMTRFPSSIDGSDEKTKYLPLGSRKQLCINEKVNALKDNTQINEKCIELQKNTGEGRCPYAPNLNQAQDVDLVEQFRDMTYSSVHDIEDLDVIGDDLKVCPYYSVRQGVPIAEVVSLPYQLLLQKDARNSLKLDLKDSVVIIDEAHNLIDTISSIYSASVTFGELKLVRKGIKMYTKQFHAKMNAGNRINLAKLLKLVTLLAKFIATQVDKGKAAPGTEVDANEIFAGTTGDLLNIYPLMDYINKSKIAFKLQTYMDRAEKAAGRPTAKGSGKTPLLFKVRSFMYCLSNTSESGKFFFDGGVGNGGNRNVRGNQNLDGRALKYLLLDPSEPFKEVVEQARCVLMAGGTMEPVGDFTDFLVPYIEKSEIQTFSCDHIIPDENLEVYPIGREARRNQLYEFTYGKRSDPQMLKDLGRTMIEIVSNVPDGVVCFFPSYHYLEEVLVAWKRQGLLEAIEQRKKVFTEARDVNVDETLDCYSEEIKRCHGSPRGGALLLSVVGGKMSEGINFSDELARAVVMVGLPYPNVKSGDLIARSRYIEKKELDNGGTREAAKRRSQELYQNICMKAVNQSVGRAIRNIKDYSVIYLIDTRYGGRPVQSRLSQWIRKRLEGDGTVETALARTQRFFAKKVKGVMT